MEKKYWVLLEELLSEKSEGMVNDGSITERERELLYAIKNRLMDLDE